MACFTETQLAAALQAYDSAGSTKERAVAAVELAESVREYLEGEDEPYSAAHGYGATSHGFSNVLSPAGGTISVGMTIFKEGYPVTVNGVTYSTAMNAFQAMKAPKAERSKFANVTWTDAVSMGREQVIDVTSWDANRETLMESILTAQAKENPAFKKIVLRNANKGLVENSMGDAFWPTALPGIWKNVRANLKEDEDDEEDDEEGDEEDEDNDDMEEYSHITSAQGKRSPAKRARSS
tara:strand:- start:181 stop:894 length:714 start_codon:yes stop_codon:yes gene_type:complete